DMPENLKNAFISIEDTRFYSHEGIDYKRLFGAFVGNLQSSNVQGGSTISQQLVKIRMLTSERSYKRKIQEAYMTMTLERDYSKDQILESYMNTILLGGSNYGVEAAANDYFDKNVSELTLRECAMLAGITQSPNKFNPRTNYHVKNTPEVVDDRTNLVLRSMYAAGRITHEELEKALEEKVTVKQSSSFRSDKLKYAYFVEYAIEDIIDNLIKKRGLENNKENRSKIEHELRTSGYKIYLTIDTDIQDTVQTTLTEWKKYPKMRKSSDAYITETIGNDTVKHAQPEAAAVVYDYKNGEYKAIVGGRNLPTAEKISNRAYMNEHGVGSSIKPITVYGPALDKGLSPNSMLNNSSSRIPGWDTATGYPSGSGPSGMVSMRSAVVSSMNRAAAHTLMTKVGVDTAAQYLLDMGVDETHITNNKTGAGLALGAAAITPVEMAVCFGTIANSGKYMQPISFTKVLDSDGNIILDGKAIQQQNTKQVYKESSAYLLTDMLLDAVSSGTGRSAKLNKMNTAGKTGTNENKTVSFSGYTPYYSASVYIGHDKNASMGNVYAGSYAAPLWKAFMTKIHEGLENKPIIDGTFQDYGLNNVSICSVSGLKATSACSLDIQGNGPVTSMLGSDSIPSASCNAHHAITICAHSHHVATDNCPDKVQIAVLRVTNEVSTDTVNNYLNSLRSQYPNFDSGLSCITHITEATTTNKTTTSNTTTSNTTASKTTESPSLSSLKSQANSVLKRAKSIIDSPPGSYSSSKLISLNKAYNSLNMYIYRNDINESRLKSLINAVENYL
ncbi:MAG: transglycosylase domain-containing protein, partial [Lachnospiraceae bacterium]|nr:transglycosylase domain-containing protein [Lachnospiraceae bacterium]